VLWNTSRGRLFETSFGEGGRIISALSYHMTPAIILIAPLYRLFPSPVLLLFLQTLSVSLGAVPLFLISRDVIKNKTFAFAFVLIYFLYPPLEYANLFDFHYATLATTFLLFCLYFLTKRRWLWFYFFLFLSITTKENLALISALLGIYLILVFKERVRGAAIFVLSVIYFFITIHYVFPALGGGMGAFSRYEYLGRTPVLALGNLIIHPINAIKLLLVEPKIVYFIDIFSSVGFLSLMSPSLIFVSASEFFLNLYSSYNPQWQINFQYTAAITPFVLVSAIYGARKVINLLAKFSDNFPDHLLALLLVGFSIVWNVARSPSPISVKFEKSRYQITADTRAALEELKRIPNTASISVMNNLGPHLSNRSLISVFPKQYLASDYVVLDPQIPDQYPRNSIIDRVSYNEYLRSLQAQANYEKIINLPRLLVFKRISAQ
jgi:uncharacterized membrane protein